MEKVIDSSLLFTSGSLCTQCDDQLAALGQGGGGYILPVVLSGSSILHDDADRDGHGREGSE